MARSSRHTNRTFPILTGQEASIQLITLQPGGIREPHWHPSAWEINLVTKGVASWVLIDGNGNHESFEARVDDLVFAPQGSLHYFENLGTEDLDVLIVQNASASEDKDNVGIGEAFSQVPPQVLSAIFGVPTETFSSLKKFDNAITILRPHLRRTRGSAHQSRRESCTQLVRPLTDSGVDHAGNLQCVSGFG